MRLVLSTAAVGVLIVVASSGLSGFAIADKTRMGCDSATEVWDATLGKCQPGTPKYRKKAVEPKEVKAAAAVKKASGKKNAPAKAPAAKAPAAK